MKQIALIIALFITGLGFSQAKLTQEVTKAMSKGVQPGIEVFIPNVSEENIMNAIKDVMKSFKGKMRSLKNTDEFFIEGAIINEIAVSPINIHQIIEKGNKGYMYTTYFDVVGTFLDSSNSPDKFSYASDLVQKVALKAIDNKIAELKKTDNLDNDNNKLDENDNNSLDDKGL